MKSSFIWCAIVGVLLGSQASLGVTIYVDKNAAGDNNGTSWVNAYNKIEDAVASAVDGATVVISDGTYNLPLEICVTNGIEIRSANGPHATVIMGNGSSRCFRLENVSARLDGLTVQGGRADNGAGVRCRGGTIRNCLITGNHALGGCGGGIFASGALTLDNTVVVSNRADFGAGIAATVGLILSNCTIVQNSARVDGGGISFGKGKCSLENTTVWANTAGRNGAGMDTTSGTKLEITASLISSNSADSATASYGGGIHVTGSATVILRNSTIKACHSAFRGGGISNAGNVDLDGCDIVGNAAGNAGGGVWNSVGRTVAAKNCRISGNSAPSGPDIYGALTSYGGNSIGDTSGSTLLE